MTEQTDPLSVAALTLGGVVLGGLITGIANYFLNRQRAKHELKILEMRFKHEVETAEQRAKQEAEALRKKFEHETCERSIKLKYEKIEKAFEILMKLHDNADIREKLFSRNIDAYKITKLFDEISKVYDESFMYSKKLVMFSNLYVNEILELSMDYFEIVTRWRELSNEYYLQINKEINSSIHFAKNSEDLSANISYIELSEMAFSDIKKRANDLFEKETGIILKCQDKLADLIEN